FGLLATRVANDLTGLPVWAIVHDRLPISGPGVRGVQVEPDRHRERPRVLATRMVHLSTPVIASVGQRVQPRAGDGDGRVARTLAGALPRQRGVARRPLLERRPTCPCLSPAGVRPSGWRPGSTPRACPASRAGPVRCPRPPGFPPWPWPSRYGGTPGP